MGCCSSDVKVSSNEPTSPARAASSIPPTLRLMCVTFNVGDAVPGPLDPIFSHTKDVDGRAADIIVIAAQECQYKIPKEGDEPSSPAPMPAGDSDDEEEDTNSMGAAANAPEEQGPTSPEGATTVGDHWQGLIEKQVGSAYKVIGRKGLCSIRLMVLARSEIADEVTDVATSREATGIGSVGGNKGGVAVGFTIRGTSMLFVGSHLAAHLEHVDKRNSDFHEIVQGISAAPTGTESGLPRSQQIEPLNLYTHTFWMGDLNYRIGNGTSAAAVIEACAKGEHGALIPCDQLQQEMAANKVFAGFAEAGPLTFTPTYRFLRNTTGEQREFDPWKSRVPSWCDRVLHKSTGNACDAVTALKYDAEHGVRSSDHSPVFAIYDVPARAALQHRASLQGAAKEYTVRVSGLSCAGLVDADVGSLSDPYVVFAVLGSTGDAAADGPGSPAAESVRTRTVDDNLNPKWDRPEDVFELVLPGKKTLAEVQLKCVHALVFDEDVVSDDSLGNVIVPLSGVKEGEKKAFEAQVLLGGKPSGSMKGFVEIVPKSTK